MTSLTTWLLAMVQPLISRILIVLGFSVISVSGSQVAFNYFINTVQDAWNGIPYSMLSLMHLAGIPIALGIIGSAVATRLFFIFLKSSSAFLARTPS
jgi:Protein of unknown function (DUF2523)